MVISKIHESTVSTSIGLDRIPNSYYLIMIHMKCPVLFGLKTYKKKKNIVVCNGCHQPTIGQEYFVTFYD